MKVYFVQTDNGGYPESVPEKIVSPYFDSKEKAIKYAKENNLRLEQYKYWINSIEVK